MSKQRDGFTFYRSYFDVYNELNDKEKVLFMDALLNKQFNGDEPTNLKGMANFAYLSQKHSIDKQIKGWEDKTGCKLLPLARGVVRGKNTPLAQEEEKEQEQLQVQVQCIEKEQEEKKIDGKPTEINFSKFDTQRIVLLWKDWKEYKLNQHKEKFKSLKTEQIAIDKLGELSNWKTDTAKKIIEQSIGNLWKGLFELKQQQNGNSTNRTTLAEQAERITARVLGFDTEQTGSNTNTNSIIQEADWSNFDE